MKRRVGDKRKDEFINEKFTSKGNSKIINRQNSY